MDKIRNLTWLAAEPLMKMASGLIVLLVVARQLGPGAFGIFSYAMAIVIIFQALARCGQEGAIMRQTGLEPDKTGEVFVNGVAVSLAISAVAAGAAAAWLLSGWDDASGLSTSIVVLVALAVFATPGEVAFGLLKALEKVAVASALRMTVTALAMVGLILLASQGASAGEFVALRSAEIALAAALTLATAFVILPRGSLVGVKLARIKSLLLDGLPLLVAGLLAVALLRVDQLMLGPLSGSVELGRYGVAVRIAEIGNFVPAALYGTLYAAAARNLGTETDFESYFQRFFDLFSLSGWVIALVLAGLSALALGPLLGPAYSDALPMVLLLLAGTPLVFGNFALVMMRSLQGWLWTGALLSTLGLLANIGFNLWLIPLYGGVGAAIATFISLLVAGVIGALVIGSTRAAGRAFARSLNPFGAASRLWSLYGLQLAEGFAALRKGATR